MSFSQANHRSLARLCSSIALHRPVASASSIRLPNSRSFASRKPAGKEKNSKHKVTTDDLIPGSQLKAAGEEYTKAEERMKAILEKYRKDVVALEMRASGRVTPAVLAPVRVLLKGAEKAVRLEEIATVGVREGTMLIVTVFEEQSLKYVEQAIYDAKIPHVIPQKMDNRTIKVPMPKPTVESRNEMLAAAQKQAEDARVHIRKQQQASLKKGNYTKYSPQTEEIQSLTTKYLSEIDKVLADVKKSTVQK
ncbi:ribosome recycling factor domain-containing protein [Sparassis latifolia]|uniref:Ribosome recycling factor n=1 Tax=Sparassis crispa TaxID=139825 RepID=A0A401GZG7_9APHY|nr:ribosome recycling factor [Sparassis crispa]GBE87548.1 ribosome recycling factor [Sparassis crispa]